MGEHSGRYAHVGIALAEAGYALLAFDLRGHGRSRGPRGHVPSWDAVLTDVDGLLGQAVDLFSPTCPRFLYGHSMGGGIVLSYALNREPDLAGVIATSPWLRTAFEPPRRKLALGKLLYKVRPGFTMSSGLDREALSHDPAVVRAYNADPLVHDRLSARLGLDMFGAGEKALAEAAYFPLPLLLMHGNADGITSFRASREFADRVPGGLCTFREWDGLYHELHNEPQKADVIKTVIAWLDAHLPAETGARAAPRYGASRSLPQEKRP